MIALRMLRGCLGANYVPSRVTLRHAASSDQAIYERYFGSEVCTQGRPARLVRAVLLRCRHGRFSVDLAGHRRHWLQVSWGAIIAAWRYLDYQFSNHISTPAMNGPTFGVGFRW
jgi:hypothetical protein